LNKDRSVYARHVYDCICRIKDYVRDGKEAFFHDTKTQDAVIRNLEVIGQAVKDIGIEDLIAAHPDVPWTQVAGARNILAHHYLGVDIALVWNIVEKHLPQLESKIIEIARNQGIDLGP